MKQFVIYIVILFISPSLAFYIPGVAPREYEEKEDVEIKVSTYLPCHISNLCGPKLKAHLLSAS